MLSTASDEAIRIILKDESQLDQKAEEYSKEIGRGRMDISALVDSLSFALTSTEVELRARGTRLFSTTLSKLPANLLNEAQISFIVQFYCDRTKDHHSVVPAVLDGILSFTAMQHIPSGSVTQIMQALFKNVSCQSQVRDDRQKIFNILKYITEKHDDELRAMGTDFVYGTINAIDGERDPRILVNIFDFLPQFLHKIPLGHLAEEMFEVCACYFPVDFHPAPDDPLSITRDRLAEKLSHCLAGHPEFAEFCIPLALEKMGSQLTIAKLDSINLLILAAQNFTSDKIDSQCAEIWTAIHAEIRMKDDKHTDISNAAISALHVIVQSTSHNEPICKNVLKVILDTIMSSVTDPDSKYFGTSSTIALTATRASKLSAINIANQVLPLLMFQTELYRDNAQRLSQIRELIANLVEICIEHKVTNELDATTIEAIRSEFSTGLSVAEDSYARYITLLCLTKTVAILSPNDRLRIYSSVNELIGESSERNIEQVKHLLVALAKDNHDQFREIFLNNWLHSDAVTKSNAKYTIKIIGSLVEIPDFTEIAIEFLFKHIFDDPVSEFQELALSNFEVLFEEGLSPSVLLVLHARFDILQRFVKLVRSKPSNNTIVSKSAKCIWFVVSYLSDSEQSSFVAQFMSSIDLRSFADLCITQAIVGSVNKKVEIDVVRFGLELARISMESAEPDVVSIGCQVLCSAFNRATSNGPNDEAITHSIKEIEEYTQNGNPNAVRVYAWLAKGLLVRGDRRADAMVQKLLDLLETPNMSEAAANAFDIITLTEPSLNLPNVRQLYQQKLFHMISTRLLKETSSPVDGLSQLRAFAFVLRMLPYQVLNMNLEKVGPILFKCLGHDDPTMVQIAIEKIDGYLAQQHEYFQSRLNHLVQSYLKLTTFKASMKIRIAALNAIYTITKYPTFVLAPFKADVLYALQASLDDPKRLVRNAASAARNQWFLIGLPSDASRK